MNKKLTAFAVLTCVSGIASASDALTVYGILDGGVAFTNKTPTGSGTNTGSLFGYQTNGESPSIFGGKGSKDLGDGMKAGFDVEGHFLTSTGTGEQWGGLFGRQANIYLSGPHGTATFGTQYSPAVLAYAATDPRGLKESFSGLMTWAFTQNPLEGSTAPVSVAASASTGPAFAGNTNTQLDIFIKNALTYSVTMPMGWMSPTDGLNISASYSFGGIAGSTQANRVIALGVSYTSPLILSFAYQTENGGSYVNTAAAPNVTVVTSGTSNEKVSVGAGYVLNDQFTVKANYLDNKGKNPASGAELTHYRIIGLGVDYKASAKNTVTLAYYDGKNNDTSGDTAKTVILSDDYALFAQLTLYGLLAQVKAGTAVSFGSSAYNGDNFNAPPVAGSSSMALQLGMKYAF
jgi:predicted porin